VAGLRMTSRGENGVGVSTNADFHWMLERVARRPLTKNASGSRSARIPPHQAQPPPPAHAQPPLSERLTVNVRVRPAGSTVKLACSIDKFDVREQRDIHEREGYPNRKACHIGRATRGV
jgi:hypothetical protein